MGNHVNEIMFSRALGVSEIYQPFTVVFTDIPSSDTCELTSAYRFIYNDEDDPGVDVSGWCTITTQGANRAVTVSRIWSPPGDPALPGTYRISILLYSTTSQTRQEANIIVPVIP